MTLRGVISSCALGIETTSTNRTQPFRYFFLLSPVSSTNFRPFEAALERVRRSFRLRVYGYVIMPEHVHLLASEPERDTLADALKSLEQGVSRRLIGDTEHFWQKRYHDFYVRNCRQFVGKLRYIHAIL